MPLLAIPQEQGLPEVLTGLTWRILLKKLSPEKKIQGINALRQITSMGLAEAKSVVDEIPTTVAIVHLGEAELLEEKLADAGFEFEMDRYT